MTDWAGYTMTIRASSVNPTKGATIVRDNAFWRQVGDSIEVRYQYHHTAAGTAGTGQYLFNLPNNYVIDSSKIAVQGASIDFIHSADSWGTASNAANGNDPSSQPIVMAVYSSTLVSFFRQPDSAGVQTSQLAPIDSTVYPLSEAVIIYNFRFSLPIVGLTANV